MVLFPKVLVIAGLFTVAAVAAVVVMCLFSDFFELILLLFFFNIYLLIWLSLVLCGTWTLSYGMQDLLSCDIFDQLANIRWIIGKAREFQ